MFLALEFWDILFDEFMIDFRALNLIQSENKR